MGAAAAMGCALLRPMLLALLLACSATASAQYAIAERALARGDYVEAWLILRPLARDGDARAQNDIGVMYALGLGVPESMVDAARWLSLAADQGNAVSQARLGWMYFNGVGVARDLGRAFDFSLAAAAAGDPWAQCNLGYSYLQGEGVARDVGAAARWVGRSARQGFAPCQRNLGLMHERGDGLPRDPVLAYAWYGVAAASGDRQAVALREQLAARLGGDELERARRKARELHRAVIELPGGQPGS